MLELKNVKKSYKTGNFVQHALKGVSLKFRQSEFVAILGPSGSGKTTLLNIIGGLDRYDSGDLIINNTSTKKFKSSQWDSYRNNCVGFIFQSYNLINHISVLDNVEMGMTLSGVNGKVKREKALQVLERVGLKEHIHKKPNQLSGGQMQRVAIARALANDPDIILADEPTGALDSKTSVQIMELIKEIAKDKLVIMVTHNPELAKSYASRIVEMKDGECLSDSNPVKDKKKETSYKIKKTAMGFLTALKLSFNNIITKKGRTILTAFASSIGIIGIALILSLSNGFDIQIDKFESETLSSMPVLISQMQMDINAAEINKTLNDKNLESYTTEKKVYPLPDLISTTTHTNKLTNDYISYIEAIDAKLISGLSYTRITKLNMLVKKDGAYKLVNNDNLSISVIPKKLDSSYNHGVIEDNYDVIEGRMPSKFNEIVLVVDSKNRLDEKTLKELGIDVSNDGISFDEILSKEIKVALNDEFYVKKNGYYTYNDDLRGIYKSDKAITLKIVGIIRGKEDKSLVTNGSGIGYIEELIDYVISENDKSSIVVEQKKYDYNILMPSMKFDKSKEGIEAKDNVLATLGAKTVPMAISIYPRDFDTKKDVLKYLDNYNNDKEQEDKILYNDMAAMISSLSGNIMDAITVVLISFSSISLIVSSIMIGIITYISVLERTKEIGILRSLGARKKDVSRVFNAETFIIGVCSGALGIIIARLLLIPTNAILKDLTGLSNVARMNPLHAFILVVISVILTLIGGFIPAKIASKKDPVEALRTE